MKIVATVEGLDDLARLDVQSFLGPVAAEIAREFEAEPIADPALGQDQAEARAEQIRRVVDRLVARGLLSQS